MNGRCWMCVSNKECQSRVQRLSVFKIMDIQTRFHNVNASKSMAKKRSYQTTSLLIYQLAKKLKRVHHHQKD